MSRIAKSPVKLPQGVEIKVDGQQVSVKGSKVELPLTLHSLVTLKVAEGEVLVSPLKESPEAWAMAGTFRSLINGMVIGVTEGFERKLQLVGVGYRAQVKGSVVNLTLGFSHPVVYQLPEGVTAEMPTNTEIVLKSANKQVLGQTAAEIRAFRPPEPYKGKGVRYADERIIRKEAKKK